MHMSLQGWTEGSLNNEMDGRRQGEGGGKGLATKGDVVGELRYLMPLSADTRELWYLGQ